MGGKGLSAVLILAGLSLVVLSVAADAIGMGGGGQHAFGWVQKLGVAAGMTLAWFAGLRLLGWGSIRERLQPRPAHDLGRAVDRVRIAA